MATLERFKLNGWQRATLLAAGLAVAIGTYEGIDPDGGIAWIAGALVATVLVVLGFKGVTSGRGPVLTIIGVVCLLVLVGLGAAFAMVVHELNAGRDAQEQAVAETAAKHRMELDRELRFLQCTHDAMSTVIRSKPVVETCGRTFLAEFDRERLAREDTFISEERAAGRDVRVFEEFVKKDRAAESAPAQGTN